MHCQNGIIVGNMSLLLWLWMNGNETNIILVRFSALRHFSASKEGHPRRQFERTNFVMFIVMISPMVLFEFA